MDIKIRREGRTYIIVQENDVVAHSLTSCWNTPGSGSAWTMTQTRKPVETKLNNSLDGCSPAKEEYSVPQTPSHARVGIMQTHILGFHT